ncbi:hypothetical protein [Kosakonia cowanii]|uniref:hypothetical protein n=1 Tax=Kosakonia cowanii TaxID=208223 RepID=UPI0039B770A3
MRLGSGNTQGITGFTGAVRVQAIGLHQNVGNTGGFKQHAAIGHNNQEGFHVLKSTLITK